ncbi:HNH endonuclease family protein [Vreelandella alkaliphila]|uniref:HNH endonuclease n=1 Tax=Halomonas campaniensis TaxID=213554 RepID=A0A3D0KGT1_9GAMM|nr:MULTISPECIES: HNH endonuclease family protein [unclassified Halomonas]HCA02674.1 HNH endonuclease [Halomonas campaniensis]
MRRLFLLFVTFLLITPLANAGIVKKSTSGICHNEASAYYSRTKNFTPYDDLSTCLDSGGRLPKGQANQATSTTSNSEYSRSQFGHGWSDDDGDCQDARAEALIASSTVQPVQFASDDRCRVTRGRWISPFTGEVIQNSSDIDIDHVVPLKFAWDHGASDWPRDKRIRFANDPVNLFPVEASLNRSKGARGLSEWMPPAGQCGYASRFVRVATIYGVTLPEADRSVHVRVCN